MSKKKKNLPKAKIIIPLLLIIGVLALFWNMLLGLSIIIVSAIGGAFGLVKTYFTKNQIKEEQTFLSYVFIGMGSLIVLVWIITNLFFLQFHLSWSVLIGMLALIYGLYLKMKS